MRPISGLDIDALRVVSDGVNALTGPNLGALDHHTLSTFVELHQAALCSRDDGWAHR